MKLQLLLTTLLLSATPAIADDPLYLKCNTTVQYRKFDMVREAGEMDLVLYYKLDLKNKLLTDSAYSEQPPNKVKIQNGMVIEELELRDDVFMATEIRFTKFEFDPPGKFVGSSYVEMDDNSLVYEAELEGICETSSKSAYEARK